MEHCTSGFGQYLNEKYYKGTVLLILEIFINIQSNFNRIIPMSFHGEIANAIKYANYQWLMFYPCLYFFSIGMLLKTQEETKPLILSFHMCSLRFV